MNERAKEAARAHLIAATVAVEADVAYNEAVEASFRAASLVGLAYERRRDAHAAVDKAFDVLAAALRAG